MALDKPYADVPGTTVFDGDQARKGYHLNQFCMSLMQAANRTRFRANERAYLDEWPMTEEQKQAVLARDYNRMISLGGNVYFLAKIFSTDGKSFQYAAALMTGMPQEAYAEMMLKGGRSPEGNRYTSEQAAAEAAVAAQSVTNLSGAADGEKR
jgi:protocatechuate 4,5-dioxygenase alpha chain